MENGRILLQSALKIIGLKGQGELLCIRSQAMKKHRGDRQGDFIAQIPFAAVWINDTGTFPAADRTGTAWSSDTGRQTGIQQERPH